MMITYQFITALSDAKPQSHLIARLLSHLPQTALVAEMRESAASLIPALAAPRLPGSPCCRMRSGRTA
jgi:hypothetical protein